jgi:membrane protease YdiL (CAAX protease family)
LDGCRTFKLFEIEANLSSAENEDRISDLGYRAVQPATDPVADDPVIADPVQDNGVPPASLRIWPIPIVVIVAFFLHLGTSIFVLLLAMFWIHGSIGPEMFQDATVLQSVTQSRLGLAVTLIVPQSMMILPVVIAAWLSPVSFTERLGLVRGTWPIKLWISSAIATPIVGLVSSMIVGGLMGESESLQDMTSIFRGLGQGGFFIPLALMVGLTPGICEELLFRGYVQTRLSQRLGGLFAILVTSIAFAAFHMDLVHSTAVVAIGVYLGWLSWASGSIFPAMIAHFVNNFLSVAAVVMLPESAMEAGPVNPEEIPDATALVMAVVVLSSVVAFVFTLRQARRHRLSVA